MTLNSVIIIDDSEADQFISKTIIKKFDPNIQILQAYDGQEALDILTKQSEQPDVIFLDINMPRMNGHEFLDQYAQQENQTTVVIMLTSSEQEKDKKKSITYQHVKKYLTKPINSSILENIVQMKNNGE